MQNSFIWSKEQCEEAYDDLMIKIAMSSYAKIDGEELLVENERLKKLSQYQLAPEIERKIRQIAQRESMRDSVYRFGKSFYSATSKAAIVFLAISAIFATTMVVSANFRSAVYRFVFTIERQYTLIELDATTALEFVDSEIYTWPHAFAPTMMPEGYTLLDVTSLNYLHIVTYTDNNDGFIIFWQNDSESHGAIQVDTEDAQAVFTVIINDSEGLAVSKGGVNTLVWRVGNIVLQLESNESLDVLMTIAEGIKLLG